MKRLMLLVLTFACLGAYAEVIKVYESKIGRGWGFKESSAKFFMDTNTGVGYAKIIVEDVMYPNGRADWPCRHGHCLDNINKEGRDMPIRTTVLRKTVEIPGLSIEDKKMTYSLNGQEINCGKLGLSRVFKVPTLFLTGNCKLFSTVRNDIVKVNLVVK